MSTQYGIDDLGVYRTRNKELPGYLKTLNQPVTKPMVDWYLLQEVESLGYSLDLEKENKSVTEPEWFWKGLNRYACPVHELGTHNAGVLCSCGRRHRSSADRGRRANRGKRDQDTQVSTPTRGGGALRAGASSEAVRQQLRDDFRSYSTTDDGNRGANRKRATRRINDAALRRSVQAVRRLVLQSAGGTVPLTVDEVVDDYLRDDSASGLPYLGHNGDPGQKDRARVLGNAVLQHDRGLDPYLFGRRVQHGSSGPKTRLVWMAPLATTVVGGMFAFPLQSALKRRRPFTWGHSNSARGAIINEFDGRFRYIYGTDYSKFDSSVPAFLLQQVFDILKECLVLDATLGDAWDLIVRDFIHARIVGPDGRIHQKHRGIPSGSAFTSLVGSVVNLILTQYIWVRSTQRLLPFNGILVMGDDALFGDDKFISPQEMSKYAGELGFTLNPEKTDVISGVGIRHDMTEWPHFLGHYWVNGAPHRPEIEVVRAMALPERHRAQDRHLSDQRKIGYAMTSRQGYRIVMALEREPRIAAAAARVMARGSGEEPVKDTSLPGSLRLRVRVEGEELRYTEGNPLPILLGSIH